MAGNASPTRIMHNITAMRAYQNYSNNNRALSSTLEKLSSGYKINSAGDDAAGLAISEKMRAQITGLSVASKNAKDGISLVQSAEGALTEVHDMLNRMYSLAEQSANGTYDNDVDRVQLQKEVDSLLTEIDRIADSSNFNGIKLLDGSMAKRDAGFENINVDGATRILKTVIGEGDMAYDVAGLKSITENNEGTATAAKFKIDLSTVDWNVTADAAASGVTAESITIRIGDSYVSTDHATGSDRIQLGSTEDATGKVTAGKWDGSSVGTLTAADVAKAVLSSLRAQNVGGNARVTINGTEWNVTADTGINDVASSALVFTQVKPASTADQARANFDVALQFGSPDSKIRISAAKALNASTEVMTAGVAEGNGAFANTVFQMKESDIFDGATIKIGDATVKLKVGADSSTDIGGADALVDMTDMEEGSIDLNKALNKISDTISYGTMGVNVAANGNIVGSAGNRVVRYKYTHMDSSGTAQDSYAAFKVGVSDNSMTNQVGIGVQRVNDLDSSGQAVGSTANVYFTTRAKLEDLFSLRGTHALKAQSGLTLQIGDTPDAFNQLSVSINDCHAAAMGISGVDISTQEGAADALAKIKDAINYVSDVRGTLGATQNRLDHTINNLSVMQTNIQDAESTIRDTDVAESMMQFTKQSIMTQAAQAMLAQANQLPQGVLQLIG